MASRQTDKNTTIIRVYKHGLIPKGPFPEEAVTELWRANKLWNNLVGIHKQNRQDFEEARCKADAEYKKDFLNLKHTNHDIDNAYNEKRNARMQANTREASHPLIIKANAKINELTKQRNAIYEQLKSSRKKADKLIDKAALNNEFNAKINSATNVKHTGEMYNETAWQVNAYFKTARDIALKTNSQLRFHRFDGTGFFNFRFRRKGVKIDGVCFEELFLGNKPKEKNHARLLLIETDDTRRKPRILMRATLAGGRKIATQTRHEFDLIYHRPIPEGSQIQDGKIIRSRVGDKFSYHLALTVKQPVVEPIYKQNYWDGILADELPSGVDWGVFDFAVNSGPDRATKFLQNIVGVDSDGSIGPITLAAITEHDSANIINEMFEHRQKFYESLKTFEVFGKGWTKRNKKTREQALSLITLA